MARKAEWSLIDAQIKARDSQDRQGRFSSPSPDRIAERSGIYSDGVSMRESYNRMAYGKPDTASLGDPISGYWGGPRDRKITAQSGAPSPED